jgi:hypothetical protein
MGKTTTNLSRHEFACRDNCGLADPHPVLVVALQTFCDLAAAAAGVDKVQLAITGPGRCDVHNLAEGGAEDSKHLPDIEGYTRAVDCHLAGFALREQHRLALEVPAFAAGGVGAYMDDGGPRLHLDVCRKSPARWARLNRKRATLEAVLKGAEL